MLLCNLFYELALQDTMIALQLSAMAKHSQLMQRLMHTSGLQGILEGGPIEGTPVICDVRDVGAAHVLAAETPSASGRYTSLMMLLQNKMRKSHMQV